jgi:3-deoxy-D-manno-octulosonate 8-phosphate phosphatase (KDO 8-P phosphatase)
MIEKKQLAELKILAMDVDGVLTDGSLFIGKDGEIAKRFDVKDGLAMSVAQRQGMELVFITGRTSPIAKRRAQELGIKTVFENAKDKAQILRQLAKDRQLSLSNIGYIGDDLIDLPALNVAGVSFAPADSATDVLAQVDYVAKKSGGHGAVREIVEAILNAKGLWQEVVKNYMVAGQGDKQ